MILNITYFSNNEVHKQTIENVSHWYYYNGFLVVKDKDDNVVLEESNTVILDSESWLTK